MTNPTYESKVSIKDVNSETQNKLNVDVETPPPPYEAGGSATSSTSSKVDNNQNTNLKQIEPVVQHDYYGYNSPQQQEYFQQDGSTIVYIEGNNNYNVPRDQYHQQQQKKKRTCIEKYWGPVINPDAWKSLLYFLFIAPVIALFSGIWCGTMLLFAIVSLIFPPLGFFFCIGTALSYRALGRLELIAATMCTSKHKPSHMYPPVFRTSAQVASHTQTDGGILRYGIRICLDEYTWMSFSPIMIVAMPVMCRICLAFGKAK
ncbi:3890_t:CDS:2, partial [Rhizophagus irregularis]